MRVTVEIEGKKYKLSFWKWLAYQNQRQLNRIDKKLDTILNECRNQSTDKPSQDSNSGTE